MASAIEAAARAFVTARNRHHVFSLETDTAYQALVTAIAEADQDADTAEAYRAAAVDQWAEEGGLEIDDDAVVSLGDKGAHVAAWVWVDKEDVDLEEK